MSNHCDTVTQYQALIACIHQFPEAIRTRFRVLKHDYRLPTDIKFISAIPESPYTLLAASIDAGNIRDSSVSFSPLIRNPIKALLPIVEHTRQLLDADSAEVLVTHKSYHATGGWLSRLIGFPQGSPPLLFKGTCRAKAYSSLFETLNITKINNKDIK